MTDTGNAIQTHGPLLDQTVTQIEGDVNNLLDIC